MYTIGVVSKSIELKTVKIPFGTQQLHLDRFFELKNIASILECGIVSKEFDDNKIKCRKKILTILFSHYSIAKHEIVLYHF